jgi:hypothetical protein
VGTIDQLITSGSGFTIGFVPEIVLHFAALFCLCMLCHGELVRLRPDPRYLTGFYLMISAGGALGGLLVSLVAPRIFTTFLEWRLGLVAGALLATWVLLAGQQQSFLRRRFGLIAPAAILIFAGLSCVPRLQGDFGYERYAASRNFYGVIAVRECDAHDPHMRTVNFYSGRIIHGLQFVQPERRGEPTSYYGPASGVGRLLSALAGRADLRVGAAGLGVGTVAAYAKPGQYFRFYEIDEDVLRLAQNHFSFLADCRGRHDVVLGDARLSLDAEPPQKFDVLILDAFSGDSIPAHLLTCEAFDVYARHLNANSVLAVHISNGYLDLAPVVAALAERFGYAMARVVSLGSPEEGQFPADWILLARDGGTLAALGLPVTDSETARAERKVLWTDDRSNLFEILK